MEDQLWEHKEAEAKALAFQSVSVFILVVSGGNNAALGINPLLPPQQSRPIIILNLSGAPGVAARRITSRYQSGDFPS